MIAKIGCVVEGHGEVQAVPVLIRRIVGSLYPDMYIDIPRPVRIQRSKIGVQGEFERAVELVAQKVSSPCAVVIILDSDDDCPAQLGPELLRRATQVRRALPIGVVLAKSEFESWFLAAAESLGGQRGLKSDLQSPPHPEAIRGAKEWLSRRMDRGRAYSETRDQPAFTARFDIDRARRADSFDKCYREIARLAVELRGSRP